MQTLLFIGLGVYIVIAVALFVGVMIAFFRKYPDGAVEWNEGDLLWYIAGVFVTSVLWPVVLVGVMVSKYGAKARR